VPAPIKLGFAPDLSKPINKAHAQPKKKAAPQAKKKTTWGLRHAHAQAAKLAPHSNLTAAGLPHSSKSSSDDTWWIVLIVVTILVLIGAALLYIYCRNRQQDQDQADWLSKKAAMRRQGGEWLAYASELGNRFENMLHERTPVAQVAPVRQELHSASLTGDGLIQQFVAENLTHEANEISTLRDHLRNLTNAPDTGPVPPEAEERALVEAMQGNAHELLRNAVATAESKMQAQQITEPPSLQAARGKLQTMPAHRAWSGGCFGKKKDPPQFHDMPVGRPVDDQYRSV
jgi:hypothetical protein